MAAGGEGGKERRERSRKGESGGNLEFGQLMNSAKALSGCRRNFSLTSNWNVNRPRRGGFSLLKPKKKKLAPTTLG